MAGVVVFLRMEGDEELRAVELPIDALVCDIQQEARRIWPGCSCELRYLGEALKPEATLADSGVCQQSVVEVTRAVTIRFIPTQDSWREEKSVHNSLCVGELCEVTVDPETRIVLDTPEGCALTVGYGLCPTLTRQGERLYIRTLPPGQKNMAKFLETEMEKVGTSVNFSEWITCKTYPPKQEYSVTVDPDTIIEKAFEEAVEDDDQFNVIDLGSVMQPDDSIVNYTETKAGDLGVGEAVLYFDIDY
eukprot:Hpha_TRINITY_DN16859_c2_g2::TRINITY_DN16859_c2_g2_i1::g.152564::m.152564